MNLVFLLVTIHIDDWLTIKVLQRVCKAYLEASLQRLSISYHGWMRPYVLFRYPNLKTLNSTLIIGDDIESLEVAYDGQFISHIVLEHMTYYNYKHMLDILRQTTHPLNLSNDSVQVKIVGNQVYFKHTKRDQHWDRLVDFTIECMGPDVDVTFINDELEYPSSNMKSLTFLEPRMDGSWIDIIEDLLINYVSTTITFRWYNEIDKEQYEEFIKQSNDKLIPRVKWEVMEENDNPS